MSKTDEFEHLLDRQNVVALEWDEDQQKVLVFVTEKLPEDVLDDEDLVSRNVGDHDSDVIDAGGEPVLETAAPTDKHRPIVSGVSEGVVSTQTAGTAGPIATVRDPDLGDVWDESVTEGDHVRLSNNHVYAGVETEPGHFGDSICQPATIDGGSQSETVGDLVGYVPLRDRGTVDCAARTITPDDINEVHDLENYPTGIRRDYSNIRGETASKSGRTTSVTTADFQATSATVRVRVSDNQTITFRDQLISGDMSDGGDSGSAVYDSSGQLTGLLFAGSDNITIINKITNVEAEFGVEMEADPLEAPSPDPEPPAEPQTLTIGTGKHFGSVEYSFDLSKNASVDFSGHSASVVGDRVNGWVMLGWTKEFTIDGKITDAAIPEGASVTLNGEPVAPDEVAERSQEIAQ